MTDEQRRAYKRRWYAEHQESARCTARKSYVKNREKSIARAKKWQSENPTRAKDVRQARRAATRSIIRSAKEQRGCKMCGFLDHRALEFHHRDPRVKDFAVGSNTGGTLDSILKEIAKCDVLCANCHSIIHYEERDARRIP